MSGMKFRSDKLLAKYSKVISNYKKISKIIAVDRLLDISGVPFKFSIFHVIDYSLLFHYFFSVIYILCTKFEDKMAVLRPLTLCPLAVQAVVKLTTIITNKSLIKQLNKLNLDLYGNVRGNWEKCLDKWLHRFKQVSTFHIIVHWVAAFLLLCFPLYGYFVLGVMVPFFELVIPFVDDTTIHGYFIALAFQLVLCVVVVSIMYSVDYIFILTLFTGTAIIDLVEEDCKALTFAIHNSIGIGDHHINDLLTTAIKRNQFMRRYLNKVCAIFEDGSLIQLYCGGFTLCVCLFVAKMSEWFAVYFVAISALYQMSLYCLMGTMIEWKSNQLSIAVYNVPWHNLCISQQKEFRYFFQMSQSTMTVKLMGSLTLNVQTGMAILKSIYSLYILIDQMY
ncbi:putative odorant receptor 83c [Bradysia coprophila]|uniref:putative odorant receptor 83c n=1 Tax=Bradysia coprophila TaxID=38358 RepID=UPI00187D95DF|nr:putative odorant receptor 83c [Bradysia coprophila]